MNHADNRFFNDITNFNDKVNKLKQKLSPHKN